MLRRIITPEVGRSLNALIEYLWRDEQKHWEESDRPKAHIFHDVQIVAAWLHETSEGA